MAGFNGSPEVLKSHRYTNGRGRYPETPGLRGSSNSNGKEGGGDGTAGDLLLRMLGSSPGTSSGSGHSISGRYEAAAGGYGGAGHGSAIPPPPPPPAKAAATEGNALKELLSQVAPQARITEKSSQLTSKASARILGKVLGEAKATSSGFRKTDLADTDHVALQAPQRYRANGTGFSELQEARRPSPAVEDRDELPEWALPDADDIPFSEEFSFGTLPKEEDDDEDQFMQRWNSMFSKGSPLVEGTATDPFKDDLRRRAKVAWKDRRGHRKRYQQRRQQRELEEAEDASSRARQKSLDPEDRTDESVSLVFDASKSKPGHEASLHE
eukprot:TRINITY_DN65250_c0_g1_i1.p1 TRINITY_DN65250_c0_g1~~TRINITY_DN65250_c0_g1_i1.p1  ORF type:complete len:326 (+),score=70.32 TRINITY_DN65250_c0_g1_i1:87-1064(+)